MEDALAIVLLFIGLPWLVFHYITKWKSAATITGEDEKLLDELHELARRLEERVGTIERIMTAENPDWRLTSTDTGTVGIENTTSVRRIVK